MTTFKFQQVMDYLYDFIYKNRSTPNKLIPSERQLSTLLQVSRTTVKYAIDKLVEERVLYKIHGKGTFISAPLSPSRMCIAKDAPDAFSMNARSGGFQPITTVLSFKVIYKYSKLTHIFPKDVVDFYELIRIRSLGERAFCIEACYFPFRTFPDANRYDFSKDSLYEYMARKGKKPVIFDKQIEMVHNTTYSHLLGLNPHLPLFLETYITRDKYQQVIEYTQVHVDPQNIEYQFEF
ncbi:GntR family transcriptional regulator [Allofustis seminis]|uniref:GntR family transcriptional regulator n=1 Tax=Allofustis seminis TaxID=166939 RepID=UPI00037F8ABC|nr:GntR family transcriptional regulator [Allofustis seminis]